MLTVKWKILCLVEIFTAFGENIYVEVHGDQTNFSLE